MKWYIIPGEGRLFAEGCFPRVVTKLPNLNIEYIEAASREDVGRLFDICQEDCDIRKLIQKEGYEIKLNEKY